MIYSDWYFRNWLILMKIIIFFVIMEILFMSIDILINSIEINIFQFNNLKSYWLIKYYFILYIITMNVNSEDNIILFQLQIRRLCRADIYLYIITSQHTIYMVNILSSGLVYALIGKIFFCHGLFWKMAEVWYPLIWVIILLLRFWNVFVLEQALDAHNY